MTEDTDRNNATVPVRRKSRASVKGDAIVCDLTDEDFNLFLAISFWKFNRVFNGLDTLNNVNIRNHEGQTLLMYTIHTTNGTQCTHLVRTLISKGTDINAQDIHGRTALMYACADVDNDDVTRNLIRQPACDPNLVDCEGNTALMFAVAADSVNSVKMLLTHRKIRNKVNVNIKNNIGLTALDMAIKLKSVECCKLIVSNAGHQLSDIKDEAGLHALIGVKVSSETSV